MVFSNVKDDLLRFGLIISIILNFNTVYYYSEYNFFYGINRALIVLMILMNLFSNGVKRDRLKKAIIPALIYYVYLFACMMLIDITTEYRFKEFSYSFLILVPLFIILLGTKGKEECIELAKMFVKIMYYLCIISLFFYVFANILGIIKSSKYVRFTWSWMDKVKAYFNIYFETQYMGIGKSNTIMPRNSLFFCEPAMFSTLITFGIMMNKIYNKNSKKMLIVFVIVQLTTTSTTGIIVTIIYFALNFIVVKKNKAIKIVLIPIVALLSFMAVSNMFVEKMDTSSGNTRLDDMVACTKAWQKSPITGTGFLNNTEIEKNFSAFRSSNKGLSTSFFVVLAHGGIFLISVYLYAFIRQVWYSIKKKEWEKTIMFLMYMMIFLTTIFQYSALSMFVVALGIVIGQYKEEKEVTEG